MDIAPYGIIWSCCVPVAVRYQAQPVARSVPALAACAGAPRKSSIAPLGMSRALPCNPEVGPAPGAGASTPADEWVRHPRPSQTPLRNLVDWNQGHLSEILQPALQLQIQTGASTPQPDLRAAAGAAGAAPRTARSPPAPPARAARALRQSSRVQLVRRRRAGPAVLGRRPQPLRSAGVDMSKRVRLPASRHAESLSLADGLPNGLRCPNAVPDACRNRFRRVRPRPGVRRALPGWPDLRPPADTERLGAAWPAAPATTRRRSVR